MRVALWSISIQLQGIVVLTVVVSAPGCGTGRPSQSMVLMRAVIPQMDRPTQTAASGSPLTLAVTPNPLNPATTLTFIVPPGGGSVVLTIYGVDGRRACRLVAADLAAGAHAVVWRGRDDTGRTLPSGVYFACLRTRELVQVSKLTIVQ